MTNKKKLKQVYETSYIARIIRDFPLCKIIGLVEVEHQLDMIALGFHGLAAIVDAL